MNELNQEKLEKALNNQEGEKWEVAFFPSERLQPTDLGVQVPAGWEPIGVSGHFLVCKRKVTKAYLCY